MKRLLCICLILLLLGALTVTACADVLLPIPETPEKPDTPIDRWGEAGGPLLIIFMLLVLPLAALCGVFALVVFLIKKLTKAVRKA